MLFHAGHKHSQPNDNKISSLVILKKAKERESHKGKIYAEFTLRTHLIFTFMNFSVPLWLLLLPGTGELLSKANKQRLLNHILCFAENHPHISTLVFVMLKNIWPNRLDAISQTHVKLNQRSHVCFQFLWPYPNTALLYQMLQPSFLQWIILNF